MHAGDRDLFNPNVMRDGMHDWVEVSERMARVLADKGYPYQFVFRLPARSRAVRPVIFEGGFRRQHRHRCNG